MTVEAPAPGHVLVVDDNGVNRLVLTRALTRQGHRVTTAENGRAALSQLRAGTFDLVLLDVMMPELDGYGVLEALRADPQLRHVPVIMSTAVDDLDDVIRCIELGAEDYLIKPVDPVLLRARVNTSLEKKFLRDRLTMLLRRFASSEVADDLLADGFELGGETVDATVMFSDIRGFTTLVESQPPADTIELLNDYYALMFRAIRGERGIVNQMLGDGIMAIFGAPVPSSRHAEEATRAALEMLERIETFNAEREAAGRLPVRIGIGIATGSVIAGFTGTEERASYTCVGDTVNLAARLEAETKDTPWPILMDGATAAALPGDLAPTGLGARPIRGRHGDIEVFGLTP